MNFSIIYVAYSTEIELRTFHSLLSLQNYHLETVTTNDSQAFRRIDARTLCHLMKSMSSQEFAQKYVLVDCRYPYEFNGGHIKVSHSPPPGSSSYSSLLSVIIAGRHQCLRHVQMRGGVLPVKLRAQSRDPSADTNLLLRVQPEARTLDVRPPSFLPMRPNNFVSFQGPDTAKRR